MLNKEGWIKYFLEYSSLDIHKKRIQKSKEIIDVFLSQVNNPYISWSAGKDSTAMLFLILENCPDIKIMTEKDDLDYPGEIEYVFRLKEKYNLNLDIINPSVSLWDEIQNYKFDEDMHSRNTDFSNKFFYSLISNYKNKNNNDGVFLGLRAEESKGREWNRKYRGTIYKNNREKILICTPIAEWKGDDVFAYLLSNNIEIFNIYWKLKFINDPRLIRKSWTIPGNFSCRGDIQWLKYHYREVYNKLVTIDPFIKKYV